MPFESGILPLGQRIDTQLKLVPAHTARIYCGMMSAWFLLHPLIITEAVISLTVAIRFIELLVLLFRSSLHPERGPLKRNKKAKKRVKTLNSGVFPSNVLLKILTI